MNEDEETNEKCEVDPNNNYDGEQRDVEECHGELRYHQIHCSIGLKHEENIIRLDMT